MDCRAVRDLADSFLADELATEMSHQLLRHLDGCPLCRAELEARHTLRERTRRAFQNARDLDPSQEFIAKLKAGLRAAPSRVPARRRVAVKASWALAATVFLAAAVGLAYRGRDWMMVSGALARAAVGDHRDCAVQRRMIGQSIPLDVATARYGGAVYGVLENLPPKEVMTSSGPANVIRRHVCVYQGRMFAHTVFEYRGELVSLLVTPADDSLQFNLPGEALPHVTPAGRIDRTSVVSFRTSRYAIFLAGDVAQGDLTALAEVVALPLYRGLAGA